jgi:hypothetical protein
VSKRAKRWIGISLSVRSGLNQKGDRWASPPVQILAHEGMHVAQSCKGDVIGKNSIARSIDLDPAVGFQAQLNSRSCAAATCPSSSMKTANPGCPTQLRDPLRQNGSQLIGWAGSHESVGLSDQTKSPWHSVPSCMLS